MKSNPVNWFEIPVADMDRAKAFYEAVLDTQLTLNTGFPGITMAWFPMGEGLPGATGTLVLGEGRTPSEAGVEIYFSVDDIEAALERVVQNGGEVLASKTPIGPYGFFATLKDTEGNKVSLHCKE